ncbi:MAG: HPr(Ser) kinase/phosphatase, partial [Bullifex sp.]
MKEFTVLDLLDLDMKDNGVLKLRVLAGRAGLSRVIKTPLLSRPGLPLSGYFRNFNSSTIQLFGKGEQAYIKDMLAEGRTETLTKIFSSDIPCCIFTKASILDPFIIALAEEHEVAVLTTELDSSDFSRMSYVVLDEVFAKSETIHGVLTEVFGIGVLITGDAGIGKSETALELIERGHRLVSDDTVKLKNISGTLLIGSGANPVLAHHMEIRGIGIINVASMYGIGAIREKKQVQLNVSLEKWDADKNYDRIGGMLEAEYLGIRIPKIEIPVRPGKDNIRKISEDKGLGVLITDHNPKATLSITDRAYVIFDGKIKIQGRSVDVANDP